mmetsp:Transcript_16338/g.37640  ORF Transcript_16338/g.37640 Transcript_16338/m.37640 type:complete len:201 (+) Transcript_16338:654-1256(+)
MAYRPGRIISCTLDWVEIATHLSESASAVPSRSPGISANCRRTSIIMAPAAFWTESIVKAANKNGSMAPIKAPLNTTGSPMSTVEIPALLLKAANNERAVKTADPMANPFPVAAVVLPRASKASVVSRTRSSNSAISAMPPALSAMGPYASVASVTPRVLSMPTAAMAIPYSEAKASHPRMVETRIKTGKTVEIIPTPKP